MEDLSNVKFINTGCMSRTEALDIKAGLRECVYQCFDGMSFAVACRSNKQDSAFPGNIVLFIKCTRSKELHQVVKNLLLETAPEDQVIERSIFNILEEI